MNAAAAIADCADTTLAVLAGGEGRRMGGPKGELTLDGTPILERLLDRLAWSGPTLLVTAPGREHPAGWQRFTAEATDRVAGEGPLRGILTALEHALTNHVVVLPVDMPNVTRAALTWLSARLREHSRAAGMMVERSDRASPRVEPLPAAFRADIAKPLIGGRLRDGQLALHRLAESAQIVVVPVPSDWADEFWTNLNTPSDLAEYRQAAPLPR